MAGTDFVSGLRRNRNTRQAFQLLDGATLEEFDTLTALAALNARRQEQVFRAVFIAYVTVPLALVATWSDIAPDSLKAWVAADSRLAISLFGIFSLGALSYWMSLWRARQIVSVLDLIRIERRLQPYTALELRSE